MKANRIITVRRLLVAQDGTQHRRKRNETPGDAEIESRVLSYIESHINRRGVYRGYLDSLVMGMGAEYPDRPRPTIGEAQAALRALRRRRKIKVRCWLGEIQVKVLGGMPGPG